MMKQTIFYFGYKNSDENYFELKIDFVFEPSKVNETPSVFIKDKEYFITNVIDEFTDNPNTQIRHIRIAENLLPDYKHFF